jgi:peptidylprolyl isomerase/peptidyl-prolyl cis-trans isomerase A (cyclophilin A)/peptidyl-prolyl cis-trans isomerase B (cyclophilin B)
MVRRLLGIALCAALPALSLANPVVSFITNKGEIDVTLDPQHAPKTVANFLAYAKAHQYDGTIFHRVINGFMIQGGGYTPKLEEKSTRAPIANEANNGLKNVVGTIAMARTMDPNSATAQFFINVADNDFLNYTAPTAQGWGYAVFGKVTKGMDVVNAIAHMPTGTVNGMENVPATPVVIEKTIIKP